MLFTSQVIKKKSKPCFQILNKPELFLKNVNFLFRFFIYKLIM